MESEGPVYLVAIIRPRAEVADEAEFHLRELMAGTRKEDGCVHMELTVVQDDPDTWVMFEKFVSRAAWEAHMSTPHVLAGNAALEPLLREPTALRFYTEK